MKNEIVTQNEVKILYRNGKQSQCRFIEAFLIPHRPSGIASSAPPIMVPNYHPCHELCPHFNLTEDLNGHNGKLEITCGSVETSFKVSIKKVDQEKTKIVSL